MAQQTMCLKLAYHLAKLQPPLRLTPRLSLPPVEDCNTALRAASGAKGISKSTRKCFAHNITNIRRGAGGGRGLGQGGIVAGGKLKHLSFGSNWVENDTP